MRGKITPNQAYDKLMSSGITSNQVELLSIIWDEVERLERNIRLTNLYIENCKEFEMPIAYERITGALNDG